MKWALGCLIFASVLIAAGCWQQPNATKSQTDRVLAERSPKPSAASTHISESAEDAAVAVARGPQDADDLPAQAERNKPPNSTLHGKKLKDDSSPPQQVDSLPPSVRLLILKNDGLAIIDLDLMIDGVDFQQLRRRLIDDFVRLADRNADGRTSWKEALQQPKINQGPFGAPPIPSSADLHMLAYSHDINRNQRIDPNEVTRFLLRETATSRLITVDTAPNWADDSPLLTWLDHDGDGWLGPRERERAAERIRLLDADGDGQVLRSELNDLVSETPDKRVRGPVRNRLYRLHDTTHWSNLLFELEDFYSFGDSLRADDLPGSQQQFGKIDADQDGTWSVSEVEALLTVPADQRIRITLPSEVRRQSFALGPDQFVVRIMPDPPEFGISDVVNKSFSKWDEDGSSGLSPEEYAAVQPEMGVEWKSVDTDKDQHVSLVELHEALHRRQRMWRCQVRMTLRFREHLDWSWADRNLDDRLTARELDWLEERLSTPKDNALLTEQSGGYQHLFLSLERGGLLDREPPNATRALSRTNADRAADNNAPPSAAWFQGMDRNADGEIARGEFLGTHRQFGRLDRDGDGFIEWSEVSVDFKTSTEDSKSDD